MLKILIPGKYQKYKTFIAAIINLKYLAKNILYPIRQISLPEQNRLNIKVCF